LPITYTLHLPEYVREEYFPDPPSEIWERSEHFTVVHEVNMHVW